MNGNRNNSGGYTGSPYTYNNGYRSGTAQPQRPNQRTGNVRTPSGNGYGQAYNAPQTRQAGTQTAVRQPYAPRQTQPGQYPGTRNGAQNTSRTQYGQSGQRIQPQGSFRRTPPQDKRWVPLFAGLLALFVIVGIIFTIAKASERKKLKNSVGDGSDIQVNAEDNAVNDADLYAEGTELSPLASSYAIKTGKTVTLGSEISSDYAIMIDLSDNTIVAEKNPDTLIYPASMTKIMTLIVAYENCKDLDDKFTMTQEITDAAYQAGASVAGFMPGEKVSIRDLLYGAILPSGADATDALAEYIGGTEEKFVELMNRKVLKLGLSNTHFTNASGLHDKDHYSTPHEMALILEYALKMEECRKVLSAYKYTTAPTAEHPEGIELTSTMFSRMVGDESGTAEVLAGKTGYTNEGLHCLASMAQTKDGKEYVLVTAHSATTYGPIFDCIDLYKRLFS